MLPANPDAQDCFTLLCLKCGRPIAAQRGWVGQEVQCPHCAAPLCVPPPRDDGQPVRAIPPRIVPPLRFNFACPRCESQLESDTGPMGQVGKCPTCGARFVIPRFSPGTGVSDVAKLIDANDQDPTPMHAYAASGHQAPRIRREADGTLKIECPRCGHPCDVAADNCAACGVPFTMEGVPRTRLGGGSALATASLVLGLLALPLCLLLVPAALAVALGLTSWLRRWERRPAGQAIAGMILGIISLLLGALSYLI
jgi:DNA-directed RNA polymerase subunit RPC12/RpoP